MATVLVVDDVETNRNLVCTFLGYQGYETLAAKGGAAALAVLAAKSADLVITDVMMKNMDGYDLARAIRSNPATETIPVIFYTADYLADRATVPTGDVPLVLAKNGDLSALIEAVEDAMSG